MAGEAVFPLCVLLGTVIALNGVWALSVWCSLWRQLPSESNHDSFQQTASEAVSCFTECGLIRMTGVMLHATEGGLVIRYGRGVPPLASLLLGERRVGKDACLVTLTDRDRIQIQITASNQEAIRFSVLRINATQRFEAVLNTW